MMNPYVMSIGYFQCKKSLIIWNTSSMRVIPKPKGHFIIVTKRVFHDKLGESKESIWNTARLVD